MKRGRKKRRREGMTRRDNEKGRDAREWEKK